MNGFLLVSPSINQTALYNLSNHQQTQLGSGTFNGSNSGLKIGCINKRKFYILDAVTLDTLLSKNLFYDVYNFEWSPDDTEIASVIPPNVIRILNPKNLTFRDISISISIRTDTKFAWDKVYNLIYFTIWDTISESFRIYSIKPDGSDFKEIYSSKCRGCHHFINVSPDGSIIALTSFGDLYFYDIFDKKLITPFKNVDIFYPHWSQDGKLLIGNFTYEMNWNDSKSEIRVKEIDGKQREKVLIGHPYNSLDWFY